MPITRKPGQRWRKPRRYCPAMFLNRGDTAYAEAQVAAQRALALDSNAAVAYVALGYVHRCRWEWPQADAAFRRALAPAPGAAEVVNQHAQCLLAAGRVRDGLVEVEHARRVDPLSGIIGVAGTDFFTAMHRYDDAAAQLTEYCRRAPKLRAATLRRGRRGDLSPRLFRGAADHGDPGRRGRGALPTAGRWHC